MSLEHRLSPFHALIFGCLFLVGVAAALAALSPHAFPGGAILVGEGGPGGSDHAITTSSTEESAPQCDPALSLAGRELPIDAAGGPRYGSLQFEHSLPLFDKEVVLTFDDGPHATRTAPILDALDRYCVKAVFFSIGEMALENPEVLREVARRGHVIGTHSFSHPHSLARMSEPRALNEILGGFAAVSHTLGGPVAPLFRFPGFNQSSALLADLSKRDISVWSVDVITGDSYVGARTLTDRLFDQLDKRGHGIVLMHDIKKATVESLPTILRLLKEKGYNVPRVVMTPTITPDEQVLAGIEEAKPRRWPAVVHRASTSEKSGSAVVADRPSPPFSPFHLDGPVFPER